MPLYRHSSVQSWLCPDFRAFKVVVVQSSVAAKLFSSSYSFCQICHCPDVGALKVACAQTSVCSKFHMSRFLCVQSCRWPGYCAFKVFFVQTFVLSSYLYPNFRLLKDPIVQTFVRLKLPLSKHLIVRKCLCLDFRAVKFIYV